MSIVEAAKGKLEKNERYTDNNNNNNRKKKLNK